MVFPTSSPMLLHTSSAALYSLQTAGCLKVHCNRSAAIAGPEQDHVWPVVEVLHHNLAARQLVAPAGTPFLAWQFEQLPCAKLTCLSSLVVYLPFGLLHAPCPTHLQLSLCTIGCYCVTVTDRAMFMTQESPKARHLWSRYSHTQPTGQSSHRCDSTPTVRAVSAG